MKKLIILLTACVMAFFTVFAAAGCGEYKPPADAGNSGNTGKPDVPPEEPDDPDEPDNPDIPQGEMFTVSIKYMNTAFSPNEKITAYWNELDSSRVYRAEVDENGVAQIGGLDGDYKITLSAVPEGYTYDPNSDNLIATNDNKDVTVNLMRLTPTSGSGQNFDNDKRITISTIGAYRATLTSPNQKLHFFYTPRASGVYSIVSLIDITANVINPILDIYLANNGGYTQLTETRDGGGSENTYTKNFKWEMSLAKESVGSPFGFVIRADSLNADAFPVNIDFYIDKDGEFIGGGDVTYIPVEVTEKFEKTPEYSSEFRYIAYENSQHVLDESLVRFNEDIGYYCMYDKTVGDYRRYEDGSPVILYVKVSKATEVLAEAFTYDLVRKRIFGKDYTNMVSYYARYSNSDGVYALTEEFRLFLVDYANSQLLFNDGNGMAESIGYNSTLSAQWLFACGYYPTK